ncbi:DUF756 domain-containing protein [Streptomyces sp. adm13(2018)]|uniref:phospholipase domain-containing protein n=1 Tax=Streptomyces sp. adm13(2018) TaxID=2479007 RepID=UPI0011CE050A|nr:DUF756 domain-containing protein [Streptomyces sp. adm13(2018)]
MRSANSRRRSGAGAGGLFDVVGREGYDTVLCHGVLEYVDDPAEGVRNAVAALRAGGSLSLLAAGVGAQFYVTSANRTDAPWTYTTESGKTIADTWNTQYSQGVTDLTVHGPNGFVRRFRSPGKTAVPEVTARHNATGGTLDLTFTNAGTTASVTLVNAYGGARKTLSVAKGATVTHSVAVSAAHHWYDVTVTSSASTDYVRRLAGHVETGTASVSDPAILTY